MTNLKQNFNPITSGKALKVTKIRENDADPGLREEEMNLLRLIERNSVKT